jgi:hypothetical protein
MNHHTQPLGDEYTRRNSSGTGQNLSSEELMKKTRRFTVEMLNNQNCTTAQISEPEEISAETIKIDLTGAVATDTKWFRSTPEAGQSDLENVQDIVLDNTNSGIDLPIVRSLLDNVQDEGVSQDILPINTDTSVTIECVIPDENVIPVKGPGINETTDFSMLETMQTTGNVSFLIEKELSSNNMELEGMRNPADYSRNSGNTFVPATGETAVRENLYEASSHVFDCYIENDSSGMHNQAYGQYLEPGQPFPDAVMADMSESTASEKKSVIFRYLQKRSEASQELNNSIRQLVRDYPLLSEHELFEQVKNTESFLCLKLNKRRLTKVLGRLKLSSGYERFRFFVKA